MTLDDPLKELGGVDRSRRLPEEFPSCVFPASVPPIHETFDLLAKRSVATGTSRGMSTRPTKELNASLKGEHEPSIENIPVLAGFRAFVAEGEGHGYWDFFRVSSNLIISIADVRYFDDQRFDLPAEDILKVRILLCGKLLDSDKKPILQGPKGIFCLHNKVSRPTYYIAGGIETKLIVLHCGADLLRELIGIRQKNAADPFQLMFNSDGMQSPKSFEINRSVYRAASDVVSSRINVFEPLRSIYIYAKAIEIVGLILQDLYCRNGEREMTVGLSANDLSRISEAQGILLENFATPPTIKRLARLVGINQTKLKFGFKAILGETISDFVRRHRMERAAELLSSSSCDVSTAAYEVGYSYSANFTNAFKRHYGYTPSEFKAQGQWKKTAKSVRQDAVENSR